MTRTEEIEAQVDHHKRDRGRRARTPDESIAFINSDHPCCLPIGDVCQITVELTALREEVERLKGALEIAFVQGAQWWEWERTSFTMWGADRNRAEAEAAKLNAAGTLGMTYEERMKRAAALSPSPAQQESDPAGL